VGRILFLHGMGYTPRRDYWREWAEHLRAALVQRGVNIKDANFGGIYYHDLVPVPSSKSYSPNFLEARQIYLTGLRELAQKNFTNDLPGHVFQSRSLIKKLVESVVDSFGDIYSYLYVDFIFQAVNFRIYENILAAGEPVHLLGYSLGAMLSYCALQMSPPMAGKVAHLIMLGNPLFWFAQGVARRVDLNQRPPVGRLTNLAGRLDIAWPHKVPRLVRGLDEHIEFIINRFNPIHGHISYFNTPESLNLLAGFIAKTWER
jgi:pimeloyl-ACP methyl ester carboxylesterase